MTKYEKLDKNTKNKLFLKNMPKNIKTQTETGINRTSTLNEETKFIITDNPFNSNTNGREIIPYNKIEKKYNESQPRPAFDFNLSETDTIEVSKNMKFDSTKQEANTLINKENDNFSNLLNIGISESNNSERKEIASKENTIVEKMVANIFNAVKDSSSINSKGESYKNIDQVNILTENDHICNISCNHNKSIEISDYIVSNRLNSFRSATEKAERKNKEENFQNFKRYNTNSNLVSKNR
jgi:hypothetical protein